MKTALFIIFAVLLLIIVAWLLFSRYFIERSPSIVHGGYDRVMQEKSAVILQAVLDMKELDQYWHAEQSGRKPLQVVVTDAVAMRPPITKFGMPVQYISAEDAGKSPAYFEFTGIFYDAEDRARIEFAYPAEGIIGSATLELRAQMWQIIDRSIRER